MTDRNPHNKPNDEEKRFDNSQDSESRSNEITPEEGSSRRESASNSPQGDSGQDKDRFKDIHNDSSSEKEYVGSEDESDDELDSESREYSDNRYGDFDKANEELPEKELDERERDPNRFKPDNKKVDEDASADSDKTKTDDSDNPGKEVERRRDAGVPDKTDNNTGAPNRKAGKEVATRRKPGAVSKTKNAIQVGGRLVAPAISSASSEMSQKNDPTQTDGDGQADIEADGGLGKKIGGFVGKAGKAGAAKIIAGGKVLASSITVIGIVVLATLLVLAYMIVAMSVDRTISHTTKYGCVESQFSVDFLNAMGMKEGQSIFDIFSGIGEENQCNTVNGSGFTGEFYPPGLGMITDGWLRGGSDPFHFAVDISNGGEGYPDAPVFAYAGGEVIERVDGTANAMSSCSPMIFTNWAYAMTVQGNLFIEHEPGKLKSRYAHMWKKDTLVKVGDIVSPGQDIGGQGNTGWSCGTHLHFEIWVDGKPTEPEAHMKANGIVYPYTRENLPPKPEPGGNNGGGGGGSGEGLDKHPATPMLNSAKNAMKSNGIKVNNKEVQCLVRLWNRESNWRVDALNPNFNPGAAAIPENQAYGIPQSGPGNKMAEFGSDWKTNPNTQIKWGIKYIKDRYGTPCGAWAHSEEVNWY